MLTIIILLVLIVSLVNQIIMLVRPIDRAQMSAIADSSPMKSLRAAMDKVRAEKKSDESNPS